MTFLECVQAADFYRGRGSAMSETEMQPRENVRAAWVGRGTFPASLLDASVTHATCPARVGCRLWLLSDCYRSHCPQGRCHGGRRQGVLFLLSFIHSCFHAFIHSLTHAFIYSLEVVRSMGRGAVQRLVWARIPPHRSLCHSEASTAVSSSVK